MRTRNFFTEYNRFLTTFRIELYCMFEKCLMTTNTLNGFQITKLSIFCQRNCYVYFTKFIQGSCRAVLVNQGSQVQSPASLDYRVRLFSHDPDHPVSIRPHLLVGYETHAHSYKHTSIHTYILLQFRLPDKSVYTKIIFLISQPKHLLWVLKRTLSQTR